MASKDDTVIKPLYMKFHLVVLFLMGINLFPLKQKFLQSLYFCYSLFWVLAFSIHTFSEGVACIVAFTDMYHMTFQVSYFISHILGLVKMMLIILQSSTLWQLCLKIESGLFKPNWERGGKEEFKLVKHAIRLSNIQASIFHVMVFVIVGNRLVSLGSEVVLKEIYLPQSNTSSFIKQRPLPYVTWFPVDQTITPYYELIYIFQTVMASCHGFYIGAADAFICGFMMQFKAQFLIIKNTLCHAVQRAEKKVIDELGKLDRPAEDTKWIANEVDHPPLLSPITQIYVEEFIRECVIHHQELIRFCDEAENVFSYLMLLQFISSLLLICFQLFYLSLTPPASTQFLSMVSYMLLMMFQVLMYCWHGNEIQVVSGEVIRYAYYDINWIVTNEATKKSLLLMMMRSQRPCIFTAGKFAFLSLQTYMSILRGSASYFMFLHKMN